MESHEALKRAIGSKAVAFAKRLGCSSSLIYKWCEPSTDFTDSGAYNPIDRIEAVMDESLGLGRKPVDALAPLFRMAHRFGCVLFPPVPESCTHKDISQQTCRTMKEVGEALSKVAEVLDDDKLSPDERRDALKELYEGVHELVRLTRMVKEA